VLSRWRGAADSRKSATAMPTLRPYQPSDWPHFLSIEMATAIEALGESTEAERAALQDRWPKMLAAEMLRWGTQLWTLEGEGGRVLGHLWLTEKIARLDNARVLEVTTMGIAPEFRGLGYGRLLMNKAEEVARQMGFGTIELSVSGNNRRARDLYRDLGYDTTRRTMRKKLHE
jgi:ribosomal protein S18 acetylase RimI-like enzyme